jgi:hypothetical protein
MPHSTSTHLDEQQTKRLLRQQIGRLRRRIDRRLRDVRRQGLELTSWREYVQRSPGLSVLAALTLGLTGAYGAARKNWTENRLVLYARRMLRAMLVRLWRQGKRWWARFRARKTSTPAEGGAHDRS